MRGKVYILVYCPIDTLQWGSTHSALPLHGLYPVKSEKNTKWENTWDPKLLCVRTLIANEKLKTFD